MLYFYVAISLVCLGILLGQLALSNPWSSQGLLTYSRKIAFIYRISLGFVTTSQKVSALFNLVCSAIVWHMTIDAAVENHVVELSSIILFVAIAIYMIWERIQSKVHEKISDSSLFAANLLLNAVCDAVVELDDDYKFTRHSPSLADLLLHGTRSQDLTQRKFTEFLFSEHDEGKLRDALKVPLNSDTCSVNHCVLKLRDSLSGCVEVEIFHIGNLSLSGDALHCVGIKECSESYTLRHRIDPAADHGVLHQTRPSDHIVEEDGNDMVVWFDASALQVLKCTHAWASFCGSSCFSCSVVDWFSRNDLYSFQLGFHELFYQCPVGDDDAPATLHLGPVHLEVAMHDTCTALTVAAQASISRLSKAESAPHGVDKVASLNISGAVVKDRRSIGLLGCRGNDGGDSSSSNNIDGSLDESSGGASNSSNSISNTSNSRGSSQGRNELFASKEQVAFCVESYLLGLQNPSLQAVPGRSLMAL